MVLLREIEVENAIRSYLESNGDSVELRTRPQGVDILATKGGRTYCIEVEGNKKPKENKPLTKSQKYTLSEGYRSTCYTDL